MPVLVLTVRVAGPLQTYVIGKERVLVEVRLVRRPAQGL